MHALYLGAIHRRAYACRSLQRRVTDTLLSRGSRGLIIEVHRLSPAITTVSSDQSDLPIPRHIPSKMDELKRLDEADPLNWTRAEYEIPSAKACGAEVGEQHSCPA